MALASLDLGARRRALLHDVLANPSTPPHHSNGQTCKLQGKILSTTARRHHSLATHARSVVPASLGLHHERSKPRWWATITCLGRP